MDVREPAETRGPGRLVGEGDLDRRALNGLPGVFDLLGETLEADADPLKADADLALLLKVTLAPGIPDAADWPHASFPKDRLAFKPALGLALSEGPDDLAAPIAGPMHLSLRPGLFSPPRPPRVLSTRSTSDRRVSCLEMRFAF